MVLYERALRRDDFVDHIKKVPTPVPGQPAICIELYSPLQLPHDRRSIHSRAEVVYIHSEDTVIYQQGYWYRILKKDAISTAGLRREATIRETLCGIAGYEMFWVPTPLQHTEHPEKKLWFTKLIQKIQKRIT